MANTGLLFEVGTYLAAQLSLTRGTTLFEGTQPEGVDECLTVLDGVSLSSTLGFGVTTGVQYQNPGLIIWCRGKSRKFDVPREQAEAAAEALAKVQATELSGTLYHFIIPGSPFLLEVDESDERKVFAVNCRVRKEPS